MLERDIDSLFAAYSVLEHGGFVDGVTELGHHRVGLIFDYLPRKCVYLILVFVEIKAGVVIIIFAPVRFK